MTAATDRTPAQYLVVHATRRAGHRLGGEGRLVACTRQRGEPIDLARIAGLPPAGVICEIMNEDGSMARVGDLGDYQERHHLKACTISQIIAHRRRTEKLVAHEQTIKLPTDYGEFDCHLYRILTDA